MKGRDCHSRLFGYPVRMKTIFSLAAFVLTAVPLAAAADPLAGLWQTNPGREGGFGHVRISPCGPALCGTVVQTFDAGGRSIAADDLGAVILNGITSTGNGAYGEGRIINPETGRSYVARLQLRGDLLDVGGCVMMICRNAGTWRRVE